CASISQCNNKHHSPSHVELPLREVAENISYSNINRCHGWQLQKLAFVQIETIASLTIRTCTRTSCAGQPFAASFLLRKRLPQYFGVRNQNKESRCLIKKA